MEICQPVESDHWTWPQSGQQSACLVVQFHFRFEWEQPPGTRGCADTQEGTRLGTFYKQLNRPGAGGTGKNGVPTWDNCMPARQQGKKINQLFGLLNVQRHKSTPVIYHFESYRR